MMRRPDFEVHFEPDATLLYAGATLLVLMNQKAKQPDKNLDFEFAGCFVTIAVSLVVGQVRGARKARLAGF